MENFEAIRWLDDQFLDAKKSAKNIPLIRNLTYFGITQGSDTFYHLVIPTKTRDDYHWWKILIKPTFKRKRLEGVSNIDLETVIIDDKLIVKLDKGQSEWEKCITDKNAVINTIPFFENWTEVFEQLSDILDRMIANKEGTDLEESTKCKMSYESAVKMLKESEFTFDIDDFDFVDLKWMFNNFNFDYARSYGPDRAYRKLLDEFYETHDGSVPDSYVEWEDILGWYIDDTPPSDKWYN